jgi:DNA-binding Lrp family transcriptional regulator
VKKVYAGGLDKSLLSLPNLSYSGKISCSKMQKIETLDKFDLAILTELQVDARLTNAELASRVGLSAAPCWRRVRALEINGFIKGYRAEIDRQKIGLGVLAFVRLDAERSRLQFKLVKIGRAHV